MRASSLLLAALAAAAPLAAGLASPASNPGLSFPDQRLLPGVGDLEPYRGDLHAHTGYSDGTGDPERAYQQAQAADWLDFFAVTDHSEWFLFPFPADGDCVDPGDEAFASPSCAEPETPLPARSEWEQTAHEARRFTSEGFLALRGFEWSSPVEGHVNVYETRLFTDWLQTGPAPMDGLYAWLEGQALDPDRWATFNHPGREPGVFDDFAYDARADEHLVSLESFNRDDDYSHRYPQALDEGWHLGTHGVTDGHDAGARLNPGWGHTVALADELTRDGLRRAVENHRTIATRGGDQDARLFVDDAAIGDTLSDPAPDDNVTVAFHLLDAGGEAFERAELLGPRGWQREVPLSPAAEVRGSLEVDWRGLPATDEGERYLLLRAHQVYAGEVQPTVVTSAIWIDPPAS